MKRDGATRIGTSFAVHSGRIAMNALAKSPTEPTLSRSNFCSFMLSSSQNTSLYAASSFVQYYKSAYQPQPHPAPVISNGPICFAMLKPNRLANQRIAYTRQGERRSSVWWRNGRADSRRQLLMVCLSRRDAGLTIVS